MTTTVQSGRLTWRTGLTIVLALLYGWVGLASAGLDRVTGLLGAVAILAALVVEGRSRHGATGNVHVTT
jgi:hypothetical protein